MKKSFIKIILLMMWITSYSFPLSLPNKYPSYTYVFAEFDVDEAYIYDIDFEQFVLYNEEKIKAFYKRSLHKGKDLLPMMKGYLIEDELSDLFIYLSMIESGFSSDIVSPKKAVGLWQFMPATARHYNLSVCNSFDERCDPVSSTNAAITYLNKLYRQFGKWYLAAMAYNCGEGRLEKAIKKAGSDELSILIDDRGKYLPLETREYMKKILLIAMIGESATLDFTNELYSSQKDLFQVEVLGGTKLKELAKLIEMKPSRLLGLNKQFTKGLVPEDKPVYSVTIPEEKMILFYLRYEFPEKKKSMRTHLASHTVSLGETLENIAIKYHSSVEEIKTANQLSDDFLILDTLLVVPVSQGLFEEILTE